MACMWLAAMSTACRKAPAAETHFELTRRLPAGIGAPRTSTAPISPTQTTTQLAGGDAAAPGGTAPAKDKAGPELETPAPRYGLLATARA